MHFLGVICLYWLLVFPVHAAVFFRIGNTPFLVIETIRAERSFTLYRLRPDFSTLPSSHVNELDSSQFVRQGQQAIAQRRSVRPVFSMTACGLSEATATSTSTSLWQALGDVSILTPYTDTVTNPFHTIGVSVFSMVNALMDPPPVFSPEDLYRKIITLLAQLAEDQGNDSLYFLVSTPEVSLSHEVVMMYENHSHVLFVQLQFSESTTLTHIVPDEAYLQAVHQLSGEQSMVQWPLLADPRFLTLLIAFLNNQLSYIPWRFQMGEYLTLHPQSFVSTNQQDGTILITSLSPHDQISLPYQEVHTQNQQVTFTTTSALANLISQTLSLPVDETLFMTYETPENGDGEPWIAETPTPSSSVTRKNPDSRFLRIVDWFNQGAPKRDPIFFDDEFNNP